MSNPVTAFMAGALLTAFFFWCAVGASYRNGYRKGLEDGRNAP